MALDIIAMTLVIMLFQLPILWLVTIKDKEIARLNTALLRAERPEVAAVKERPVVRPEPEPMSDEDRAQLRARREMFKV